MRLTAATPSVLALVAILAAGCGRQQEAARTPTPAIDAASQPAPAAEPAPEIPPIALAADGSPEFPFHKLLPGMHRRDVIANCGEPQRTRVQDGKDELEYHRSGVEPGLVYRVVLAGDVIERVIRTHGIPALLQPRRGNVDGGREVAAVTDAPAAAITPPEGAGIKGAAGTK